MAPRLWLLVEWVDERNVFPSYGVVNVDSLVNCDTDLRPGKLIFIRVKHANSARRAQILRVSEQKSNVKEHKLLLERQDHQVKNVLSLCMRTIKEMKSEPLYFGSHTSPQSLAGASGSSTAPRVLAAGTDSTSSDSDSDNDSEDNRNIQISKSTVKYTAQYKRLDSSPNVFNESANHGTQQRRRTVVSCTPLLRQHEVKDEIKLTFDQGTQTDEVDDRPQLAKIEQMEVVLKKLYSQFLSMVGRLKLDETSLHQSTSMDVSEERNETEESDREQEVEEKVAVTEEVRNSITPSIDTEAIAHTSNARTLHVRRVSAHTTNCAEPSYAANNLDMVPLGAGNVTVPARLINEINWDSYSTATRQLLQAVFPRRILATHSLSGKQSPAFAHRPPKKRLDPQLTDDIVSTVSERCGVSKRLVRSSITTKCTDEAKLYRNRQSGRHARQVAHAGAALDQENVPPSPLSSHGSSNVTD